MCLGISRNNVSFKISRAEESRLTAELRRSLVSGNTTKTPRTFDHFYREKERKRETASIFKRDFVASRVANYSARRLRKEFLLLSLTILSTDAAAVEFRCLTHRYYRLPRRAISFDRVDATRVCTSYRRREKGLIRHAEVRREKERVRARRVNI